METMEEKRKRLLGTVHQLMGQLGMDDVAKGGFLSSYGAESCAELSVGQLMDAVDRLTSERIRRRAALGAAETPEECAAREEREERKKWQRRLLAACGETLWRGGHIPISGWSRAEFDRIKAVCCRAAKVERFDDIGIERLRDLYNAFLKQNERHHS